MLNYHGWRINKWLLAGYEPPWSRRWLMLDRKMVDVGLGWLMLAKKMMLRMVHGHGSWSMRLRDSDCNRLLSIITVNINPFCFFFCLLLFTVKTASKARHWNWRFSRKERCLTRICLRTCFFSCWERVMQLQKCSMQPWQPLLLHYYREKNGEDSMLL